VQPVSLTLGLCRHMFVRHRWRRDLCMDLSKRDTFGGRNLREGCNELDKMPISLSHAKSMVGQGLTEKIVVCEPSR
jgi:hypothetical protein